MHTCEENHNKAQVHADAAVRPVDRRHEKSKI